MTADDVLYRYRLRALALAAELGNVRAACRALGIHHSTYYRWRALADRHGLEMLRPRERRAPRMPNQTSPMIEQRVLAFALAHPGHGPGGSAPSWPGAKWGGIRISANGVWRVLRRHGLITRARRLALVAGYAAPPEPARPRPGRCATSGSPPGRARALDCFFIGRLSGTKGGVWQYTAIDATRPSCGPSCTQAPATPRPGTPRPLAHRVAADLAERGWRPRGDHQRQRLGVHQPPVRGDARGPGREHRRIHAGRPQSNGFVERVQRTVLEECWRPAFARYLIPKLTGLRRELDRFLWTYNHDRAHNGRITQGRTPDEVLGKAAMWTPQR